MAGLSVKYALRQNVSSIIVTVSLHRGSVHYDTEHANEEWPLLGCDRIVEHLPNLAMTRGKGVAPRC